MESLNTAPKQAAKEIQDGDKSHTSIYFLNARQDAFTIWRKQSTGKCEKFSDMQIQQQQQFVESQNCGDAA